MALSNIYNQINLSSPSNPMVIPGFVPCDNNTAQAGGSGAVNQLVSQSNGAGGNLPGPDVIVTPGAPVQTDLRLGGPNPNILPTTAQAGLSNGTVDGDNAASTCQGGGQGAQSTGLFTSQGAMSRGQITGGGLETALAAN
jgi:hypothetical protein